MVALILTAVYLSGLVAAVHAVMTVRTAQGAIAWSVSLVSFPMLALPAYLVFGRSKFSGMVEAHEQHADKIDELIHDLRDVLDPWVIHAEQNHTVYEALRKLSGLRLTRGNSVELLIDGEATFKSILAGIAAAKDYVLVQFYMIHDDGLGRRLQAALLERAAAGVRVFVLYDEVGSSKMTGQYLRELHSAGVEVSSFNPTQGALNRFQLNFRNHRKMVVVDGEAGWVGGHNVGDEYLGLDPGFSPWRDTHVKLIGPVALQLQSIILADWYWATRELPKLNWTPVAAEGDDKMAMILPFSPSQRLESAGLFVVAALQSARERIWISAPYFVPDEAVVKALELAALRGVDVRIIVPGTNDNLLVHLAEFHYIDQLRDLGIKFYAYDKGFLHAKTFLVDDEFTSIGTVNFDNRSFRLNFEVTALIVDAKFGAQMHQEFEKDFANSIEIDPTALDQKPFWWRLGVNLSRLASPVL